MFYYLLLATNFRFFFVFSFTFDVVVVVFQNLFFFIVDIVVFVIVDVIAIQNIHKIFCNEKHQIREIFNTFIENRKL